MKIEFILSSLGYHSNDGLIEQVKRILSACDLSDSEISHILNLHEKLKLYSAFVAISNSKDVFKIKCESNDEFDKKSFNDTISEWSKKYKMDIKKLENKETYYILGRQNG